MQKRFVVSVFVGCVHHNGWEEGTWKVLKGFDTVTQAIKLIDKMLFNQAIVELRDYHHDVFTWRNGPSWIGNLNEVRQYAMSEQQGVDPKGIHYYHNA
jgi:hypothetical protein